MESKSKACYSAFMWYTIPEKTRKMCKIGFIREVFSGWGVAGKRKVCAANCDSRLAIGICTRCRNRDASHIVRKWLVRITSDKIVRFI